MKVLKLYTPYSKKMSAISLAKETLCPPCAPPMDFLTALQKKFPDLPDAEEISKDEDLMKFFQVTEKTSKKKKTTPEERRGVYDGGKCDARVWHEKKGTGGLGYDDIQCSLKKVDGGCFCKRHGKMHSEGTLWTGVINEPRPETPTKPDGTVMEWSTDTEGNDIVKEKKKKSSSKKTTKKKKAVKKKSADDLSIDELMLLLKKKQDEEKDSDEGSAEGSEGGVGAGVDPEKDEDEEDDIYLMKEIDGVSYQINKEDKTVIRVDDFEIVGKWDVDEEEIVFNEEE